MAIRLVGSLGTDRVLPVTISWTEVPLTISVPTSRLVGRRGSVRVGERTLDTRQFRLSGSIYIPDYEELRAAVDDLIYVLMQPPVRVYQHHEDERYLEAEPLGSPQQWIGGRVETLINVPMVALDPLFYGTEDSHNESIMIGNDDGYDEFQYDWTVAVDGTAPTVPLIEITFGSNAEDVILTNVTTGQMLDLIGHFQSGDVVVVDPIRFEATKNNVRSMSILGNTFLFGGFELWPGSNDLSWESADPAIADVKLSWRSRFF